MSAVCGAVWRAVCGAVVGAIWGVIWVDDWDKQNDKFFDLCTALNQFGVIFAFQSCLDASPEAGDLI